MAATRTQKPAIATHTILLAAILAVLLAAPSLTLADLLLVDNSRPTCIIVLPDKPTSFAFEGAAMLADHIKQISGAKIRTIRENALTAATVSQSTISIASGPDKGLCPIIVGKCRLLEKLGLSTDSLGPGGILIDSNHGALVLAGNDNDTDDPSGTRNAVTTFLEDQLGVRYLWPGESGKVVPRRKTITVKPLNLRHTPVFKQRHIRWYHYNERTQQGLDRLHITADQFNSATDKATETVSESGNWMDWQRMGGSLHLRSGDGSILSKQTWARFLREHPEWFAMQLDGSRFFDPSWERPRLCTSNPDLIKAIINEKLKELAANPGLKSVSLITQDNGSKAGFCMCPSCRALDVPTAHPIRARTYNHKTGRLERFDYVDLSDRMVTFYNAIAAGVLKKYPDVIFTGQAYSQHRYAPIKVKPLPSIVIRYVHGESHWLDDEVRAADMADWDAWARMAGMIFWRPNSILWGRNEGILGLYLHKMAQDFRHIAANRCVGTDFDSCMHNWSTQGLTYYVLAKLHWDSNLKVDAVVDDYCRSGFGNAHAPINRYFQRVEQLTDMTAARHIDDPDKRNKDITLPYTPQVCAELRGLLDQAAAYDITPEIARRIEFLRVGLSFTDLQARIYRYLRILKDRPLTDDEKACVSSLLDDKWLMMRKILIENHYAVNVANIAWGEWYRFKALGWKGPSPETLKSVER